MTSADLVVFTSVRVKAVKQLILQFIYVQRQFSELFETEDSLAS